MVKITLDFNFLTFEGPNPNVVVTRECNCFVDAAYFQPSSVPKSRVIKSKPKKSRLSLLLYINTVFFKEHHFMMH